MSVKFESEFYHFRSRKCIRNWRLPRCRPFCPGQDELQISSSHISWNHLHQEHPIQLPDGFEISCRTRQFCCRALCKISERFDNCSISYGQMRFHEICVKCVMDGYAIGISTSDVENVPMWWRLHDVLQVHVDRIEAGQRMLEDARQRKISKKYKKKATKGKKINQVNRKKWRHSQDTDSI